MMHVGPCVTLQAVGTGGCLGERKAWRLCTTVLCPDRTVTCQTQAQLPGSCPAVLSLEGAYAAVYCTLNTNLSSVLLTWWQRLTSYLCHAEIRRLLANSFIKDSPDLSPRSL